MSNREAQYHRAHEAMQEAQQNLDRLFDCKELEQRMRLARNIRQMHHLANQQLEGLVRGD